MAIVTETYNANGTNKIYTVASTILSQSHCRVDLYYDDGSGTAKDHQIPSSVWDVINNSIVFNEAPADGYIVKITISTDGEGLATAPTINSKLAANIDDIVSVAVVSDAVKELGTRTAAIDSLYNDKDTLDSLYNDKDTLDSLYADKATLDSLYADKATLDSVATDSAIHLVGNDISGKYSYIEDNGSITEEVTGGNSTSSIYTVAESIDDVTTNAENIVAINTNSSNINAIITNTNNIVDIQNASSNAAVATAKALEASSYANQASISATNSESSSNSADLRRLEAEAFKMTADSYATEPEDVYVKVYTSNGDGTFTATNTTTYSALHWRNKASSIVTSDALLINNNLSDVADVIAARTNLGLDEIIDSLTASIANLATAQASIVDDGNSITIDTTQKLIPIEADAPSTNDTIFTIDSLNDTMEIKTNASINFFSNMVFTSSTPTARNVSIKVINVADDSVIDSFDMTLTIPNGNTETLSHTFLLTVGKNGTPAAPLTIRFEIVADDSGYSLDSFNAVIATSSSYDISTDASGINYDNTVSGSTATNVQDALDEALDLDLGGL